MAHPGPPRTWPPAGQALATQRAVARPSVPTAAIEAQVSDVGQWDIQTRIETRPEQIVLRRPLRLVQTSHKSETTDFRPGSAKSSRLVDTGCGASRAPSGNIPLWIYSAWSRRKTQGPP